MRQRTRYLLLITSLALMALGIAEYHYRGSGAVRTSNPSSFLIEVAKGNWSGHSVMNKFGQNKDIDIASGYEDIWDGGGSWVPPTTARLHDITSTSVNDDLTGSGAELVQVYGLDSNFVLQNESVTLNGTSNVATANTYTMIHRIIVTQSNNGANDAFNAGIITATAQTDSTVTAQIAVGNNQTLMAVYQVPASTSAYLLNFYASLGRQANAISAVKLLAKPDGQPWQLKDMRSINAAGTSRLQSFHRAPPVYSAKTILKLQADTDTDNVGVAGGFDLLLVSN